MNPARARAVGRKGAQSNQNTAAVKRDIGAGRLLVSDALDDPRASAARVFDLVRSMPKWGRVRASKLLERADLTKNPMVRELTARQRQNFLRAVTDDGFYADRRW